MVTAYVRELDELRQEVRQNVAGTISFWPKVAGTGNVTATAASWEIYSPSGGSALATGSGTISAVGTPSISRIDIAVPAQATLDEDYQARITWRASGESADRFTVVMFDVVLVPWGPPTVSLNDLLEERAEIGAVLERLGRRFSPVLTEQEMAAIYAVRARVALDVKIRSRIEEDAARGSEQARRPHLILNQERLNRVERLLALAAIYQADMSNPDDEEDDSAAMFRHFTLEGDSAWASVGPLKYDRIEDLVADSVESGAGRIVRTRRSY